MLRVVSVGFVACSLAAVHVPVRAEDDGPAPVNTSASLSAGADENISSGVDENGSSDGVQGHPQGTYTGVAPGNAPTHAVTVPTVKVPAMITWPGFQMRSDGSSRVFVQSTTALVAQPSAAPGKYLVTLPGAHVAAGTNRLPLETRFFNTPVTRVSLSVNREGAHLVLDLRADVTPQISSERDASGYYFTYIDLPKGNFVAGPDKPKSIEAASLARVSVAGKSARPDDFTTTLDSNAEPDSADLQRAERELPPNVKAHTSLSGHIKLGQ